MPTSETTTEVRDSQKAVGTAAAAAHIPHKLHGVFSANRLVPEIILIILSFLDYSDQPSRLVPILTLCKPWARLALELIYEQPVLTLRSLPSFNTTLGLQDRLLNGQTPFWETNVHLDGRKGLGIDYRSLIKKPCRIIDTVAPSKQDLVQLWDLQALLWTVPALAATPMTVTGSSPLAVASSSPISSPPQSPLSPPPSPSPIVPSSSSRPLTAPTPPTVVEELPSSGVARSTPESSSPPRRSASSSPSPSKAVLPRRQKKTLPPPGPVVMMLESTAVFSEIVHDILREVPGMKLRHLHYRLLPSVPLPDLIRNHMSSLQALVVSRSPTRLDDFMIIAQLLSGNNYSNNSGDDTTDTNNPLKQQQEQRHKNHIHTLALDRCQGAGTTALIELVRACGSRLRTLEFRQHTVIRPAGGDLAQFPLDTSGDWNAQEIAQRAFANELTDIPSTSTCEPGQACRQCGSFADSTSSNVKPCGAHVDDRLEEAIEDLSIANATVGAATTNGGAAASTTGSIQGIPAQQPTHQQQQQQQPQQQGADNPSVGVDPETRMDLAMLTVSKLCPRLTRLRLQNMTWLSDNSLAGFRPTYHYHQQQEQQRRGLKEIELLDSYYASQVTIEGLLELCGPDLEILVVDRKSCWRTRTQVAQDTHLRPPGTPTTQGLQQQQHHFSGLCAGCINQERLRRFKSETMSTGDRIISGLLLDTTTTTKGQRGQLLKRDSCSIQQQEVDDKEKIGRGWNERPRSPRLSTLILVEHWVSVQMVKEALCEWSRTLAVVSLRLYKCSNQELEDALLARKKEADDGRASTTATALEKLELSLPWIGPNEAEKQFSGLVEKVFEAHASLTFVEINRRTWIRRPSSYVFSTAFPPPPSLA
ncbi:hypothetical protein BGZ97_011822 [Linnemannia gamsii]|uniref:Uncharacterized protein n=1 Tax=Linnemannia gamsii TaxID=64522 RepID=A0A9P6R352_9FUNG|nr:hypothetical protein BGZ97_011822 [Linnemannia gamsii]